MSRIERCYLPAPWSHLLCRSVYILGHVSSQCLLSVVLNWFKLVDGPFGQSNVHRILDLCTDQLGRNRMHQKQKIAKVLLSNLYYYQSPQTASPPKQSVRVKNFSISQHQCQNALKSARVDKAHIKFILWLIKD